MGTASSIVADSASDRSTVRSGDGQIPGRRVARRRSSSSQSDSFTSARSQTIAVEPAPRHSTASGIDALLMRKSMGDASSVGAYEGLRESSDSLASAHTQQLLRESIRMKEVTEHRSSLSAAMGAAHLSVESSGSFLALEAMMEMSGDPSLSLSGPAKGHRTSWSSSSIESIATSLMLEHMQQADYPGIGRFSERSFEDTTHAKSMLDVLGRPSQGRSMRKTKSFRDRFGTMNERLSPITQSPDIRTRKAMFEPHDPEGHGDGRKPDGAPRNLSEVLSQSSGGSPRDGSNGSDFASLRNSGQSIGDESVHTLHTGASFQLEQDFSPMMSPRSQRYDAHSIALARSAAAQAALEGSSLDGSSDGDVSPRDSLRDDASSAADEAQSSSGDSHSGPFRPSRPSVNASRPGRTSTLKNRMLTSAVSRSARASASSRVETPGSAAENASSDVAVQMVAEAPNDPDFRPRQRSSAGAVTRPVAATAPTEARHRRRAGYQSLSSVASPPQGWKRRSAAHANAAHANAAPAPTLGTLSASRRRFPYTSPKGMLATPLPPIEAGMGEKPRSSRKLRPIVHLGSFASFSSQEDSAGSTDLDKALEFCAAPALASRSISLTLGALPGIGKDPAKRIRKTSSFHDNPMLLPEQSRDKSASSRSAKGGRQRESLSRNQEDGARGSSRRRRVRQSGDRSLPSQRPSTEPMAPVRPNFGQRQAMTVGPGLFGLTIDTSTRKAKASTIAVDNPALGHPERSSGSVSILKDSDVMVFNTNLFAPHLDGTENIDEYGIWRFGGAQDEPWSYHDRIVNVQRLGAGVSSVVYKGFDLLTQHIVAVKVMRIADRKQRQQFKKELEILYMPIKESHKRSRRERRQGSATWAGSSISSDLEDVELVPMGPACDSVDDVAAMRRERHSLCSNPTRHLVKLLDAFCCPQDNTVSIVMEYMNGGSLQDVVDRGGVQDEVVLASIAFQCLVGLCNLHQLHVIHRDIKPANLLMANDGTVKISDFGICGVEDKLPTPKVAGHSVRRASANHHVVLADDQHRRKTSGDGGSEGGVPVDSVAYSHIGTVWYMSPERIHGEEYGYNCDVWALGLSLVTIALGTMPLSTENMNYWKLRSRLRHGAPPTLPDDDTRWSAEFRDFISQMLTKDATDRPSADQLLFHPFLANARRRYREGLQAPLEKRAAVPDPHAFLPEHQTLLERAAVAHLDEILDAIIEHCEEVKQKPSAKVHPKRPHEQASSTDLSHVMHANKPGQLKDFAFQLGLGVGLVQRKLAGMQLLIADIRPGGVDWGGSVSSESPECSLSTGSFLNFSRGPEPMDSASERGSDSVIGGAEQRIHRSGRGNARSSRSDGTGGFDEAPRLALSFSGRRAPPSAIPTALRA